MERKRLPRRPRPSGSDAVAVPPKDRSTRGSRPAPAARSGPDTATPPRPVQGALPTSSANTSAPAQYFRPMRPRF